MLSIVPWQCGAGLRVRGHVHHDPKEEHAADQLPACVSDSAISGGALEAT